MTVPVKGILHEALVSENHVAQVVDFPTRRDPNGTKNTLGLLPTTHQVLTTDVRPLAGIKDHDIVNAKTNNKLKQKPSRKIPLWKSVDNEEFRNLSLVQLNFVLTISIADHRRNLFEESWSWIRDRNL